MVTIDPIIESKIRLWENNMGGGVDPNNMTLNASSFSSAGVFRGIVMRGS